MLLPEPYPCHSQAKHENTACHTYRWQVVHVQAHLWLVVAIIPLREWADETICKHAAIDGTNDATNEGAKTHISDASWAECVWRIRKDDGNGSADDRDPSEAERILQSRVQYCRKLVQNNEWTPNAFDQALISLRDESQSLTDR